MAYLTGFGAGSGVFGTSVSGVGPMKPQAPAATPTQTTATPGFTPTAAAAPTNPVNSQMPGIAVGAANGMPTSGYGMNNPYHTDVYPVQAPPPAPTQEMYNDFLPPLLASPYENAINGSQNQANWFGAATPQAAAFQNALYGPGMTPMEQMFAGSAAELGARQLGQTHNRIANMFENSSSHSNLAPAMFDATNQFNAQLNNMIGQMGTQRQNTAANLLPFTAGFPIQAWQAGMQGSQGMYDMLQNAMYGDLSYPLAVLGSNPVMLPTTVVS